MVLTSAGVGGIGGGGNGGGGMSLAIAPELDDPLGTSVSPVVGGPVVEDVADVVVAAPDDDDAVEAVAEATTPAWTYIILFC